MITTMSLLLLLLGHIPQNLQVMLGTQISEHQTKGKGILVLIPLQKF